MSEQVIKLSDNAANRIKEIMSKADNTAIGVRVGVKSGGCAGMSYMMEYAKEAKKNEEVIDYNFIVDKQHGDVCKRCNCYVRSSVYGLCNVPDNSRKST